MARPLYQSQIMLFWMVCTFSIANASSPVELLGPADKIEVSLPLTLGWKKNNDTKEYLITIYRGDEIVFQKVTQETSIKFQKMKPGPYLWSVRAGNLKTAPSASKLNENRQFEVVRGRVLQNPRPKILWPTGRVLYRPVPLTFTWIFDPKDEEALATREYVLTLFQRQSDGMRSEVRSLKIPVGGTYSREWPGSILTQGNYLWVLSVFDRVGNEVSRSASRFSVESALDESAGHGRVLGGFRFVNAKYKGSTASYAAELYANMAGPKFQLEYFLTDSLVFIGGYQFAVLTFEGDYYTYSESKLGFKLRRPFGQSSHWKWGLSLLGNYDTIPEITPLNAVLYRKSTVNRIGASGGLSIYYKPLERLQMRFESEILRNMDFSDGGRGRITQREADYFYRAGVGFEGAWFWPLGMDLSASYVTDGFSYATRDQTIKVRLSGLSGVFALLYLF